MISKRVLRKIKREFSLEKPTVWIGKNGLTADLIEETKRQLDQAEVVKCKLHIIVKASTEEIARTLSAETVGEIVDIRGRSFILYKPVKTERETK